MNLFLGIDGGQSHTHAVIGDEAGRILGRGRAGPSNHADEPGGDERLRHAIIQSASAALRALGGPPLERCAFDAVHCAMTGSDTAVKARIIRELLPTARRLTVGHDAPAALWGATGGAEGIVVIAGTGSAAYGETRAGRSGNAGGWGYLFGDEGAGFWLAREGVRAAMRAADGLDPPTSMGQRVLEHLGAVSLRALAVDVYAGRVSRDRLAGLAPLVHGAAIEGDEVARTLVERGGGELARLAARVVAQLDFGRGKMPVAPVGGGFQMRLVREAFERSLAATVEQASIVRPRFGPEVGALIGAYRLAGLTISEALLAALAASPAASTLHPPASAERSATDP